MSQRTRNIILWVVAVGLLVSMVISFTPGTLFGNRGQDAEGAVALNVNGQPIRELEVARLEQQPPFNAIQEGPAAEDLERVLLDELVTQSLVRQAAADEPATNAEVRERVNEFRESQNVAGRSNDRAYLNLLASAGYSDESFRELMRAQIQQEKYLESLSGSPEATDAEIETFFAANPQAYQSEPRITAREIVVTDKAVADALYARALTGEDFAALARENSTERAEQGGALGAAEGESAPQPVTSVALPTAVSDAAFALQGPGLTTPIEAGGAFHIVSVEAYAPAQPRPLDEVRDEVREDVVALKESGAEESGLRELKAQARITAPEGSAYTFKDPTVATVGDYQIKATELDRATYLNPQIQQLLTPESSELISSFLKPNNLDQLIDVELAYQGAERLEGAAFVGTRSDIAASARGYVGRDAEVTPAEVETYYEENRATYTSPATAFATRVNFDDEAAAGDFRQTLSSAATFDPATLQASATEAGGTAQELGSVSQGSQPTAIDTALFDFEDGMTALGESGYALSSVLAVRTPGDAASGGAGSGGVASGGAPSGGAVSGGAVSGGAASGGAGAAPQEQFVVLVAARAPERVRPLEEVRALAEAAVLAEKRGEAQQTWLDGLREDIPVENMLAESELSDAERTAIDTAESAAQALSGGAQSGGAGVSGGQSGAAPSPQSGGAD